MKNCFYIILLFIGQFSFGQNSKKIEIPLYANKDTSLWYKNYSKLQKELKFTNLIESTDTFRFRFWTHNQALVVWSNDKNKYFASVTSFAQRYDKKLLKKNSYVIDKVFFKTKTLDSLTAKNIFQQIESLKILGIPTDEKIKGWNQGLDGVEYLIETSDIKNYSFKEYWAPYIFADKLNEAKRIQQFVNYIFNDLKIREYYDKLKLPNGTYLTNGTQGITIRTITESTIGARNITDLL